MGVEFYVACHDCKRMRNLDKFYAICRGAKTRRDALELSEQLKTDGTAFRCALLTSFLSDHRGHSCSVFSEHERLYEVTEDDGYVDDGDLFWNREPELEP